MRKESLVNRRLLAVFLVSAALFNYPLLSLVSVPRQVWGVPLLVVYLYAAWLAVVALAFVFSRRVS
jgi:hypothetical protein